MAWVASGFRRQQSEDWRTRPCAIDTPTLLIVSSTTAELSSTPTLSSEAFVPIVLNRKNTLFAGHDQGAENWACIASLIETCKLNGADPQAYFTDVLTKLVNLWPASRLDELMPWAWAVEHSANRKAA
jgi:hypothetical protein